MKVLVFDTETSGLPAERNSPITDTEKYPYILQLSYKVYDTTLKKTLAIHDNYIKVADNVVITPGSIAIHGITRDILESRGIPIEEALARFDAHVALSDVVVAHNLQFDKTLLQVEYERLKVACPFTKYNVTEVCTMLKSIDICKLPNTGPFKGKSYKWPRLSELHQHCFQTVPIGLHNALTDVEACLRCYVFLFAGGFDIAAPEPFIVEEE